MGRLRRVLRWVRRVVVGTVALAVLAIAVALIALHTDWGREQVRQRAEAALAQSFPGGARIGRVEGSVLGDLVLRDIELRDGEHQPTITIDRLTLDVGYAALLRGEIALESLALDGVTLRVRMPAGGGAPNVATLYRSNPEPSSWDVAVRQLSVRGGAIEVDRGNGTVEHLEGVELNAALSMRATGTLAARGALRATWRERAAPLTAAAEVTVDAAGVVQVAQANAALGDVALIVRALRIAGPEVAGTLEVSSAEGALARLAAVPTLASPATALTVTAAPGAQGAIAVQLTGAMAGAEIDGTLVVDARSVVPRVDGTIAVAKLDLAALLPTLPPSELSAKVAIGAAYHATARGLAAVQGKVELTGSGTVATVALDDVSALATLAGGDATLTLSGRGPGGTTLAAGARVRTTAEGYQLEDGTLTAAIESVATATKQRAPVDGAVALKVAARGTLAGDAASVTVDGTATARRLRGPGQVRVGAVTARFAVTGAPAAPKGEVDVVATSVAVGAQRLSRVHAQARGGLVGPIDVDVDASDRARGLTAAVAASVTLPTAREAATHVALGSYRLAAQQIALTGRGGAVTVDETRIAVRGVRLRGGGGTLALDGEVGRGARASDRSGALALTGVKLATLRSVPGVPPAARGTVDLRGRFSQRGAAITGAVTLDGRGVALAPGAGTVDVKLAVDANPRALTVALDGRGAGVGAVAVALAITPPRRLDDLAAWQRLDRAAVRTLTIESERLDLAAAAALAGVTAPVSGILTISTADELVIAGRGLSGPDAPAPLDLDVTIDAPPNAPLALRARASLGALGTAEAAVGLRLPQRPLSPSSWRALGPAALDSATLSVPEVTIDHALARALGLGEVRGRLAIAANATAGLRGLEVRVDGRELVIARRAAPATAVATVRADESGVALDVEVGLVGAPLLSVAARSPTPLPRLLDRRVAPASWPITGTATLVEREVAVLAKALAQPTRLTGRVRGAATLSGTVGAPVAAAALVVSDLGASARGRGGIRQLDVDLDYTGGVARAEVRGRQDDGGSLDIVAEHTLARGTAPHGSVRARGFQLAPIAQLMPATLLGVRGALDADLQLRGGAPRSALITGLVRVSGVQAPLADVIGNLRDGAVTVTFAPGAAKVELTGNVESGRIDVRASAVLDGVVPRTATIDVGVRELTLITSIAPRIAGDLHVDLDLRGEQWVATARVRDGTVNVPAKGGRVLHPAGAPLDLVFTDDTSATARIPITRSTVLRTWLGTRPTVPQLALTLTIEPVAVVAPQLRGEVSGQLALTIGVDGAAVDGRISVDSGTVVVLERRYSIRRAELVFDGSIDPLLGVELEYQFPELALRVGLDGRLSQPRLVLTSTPGTYTEGQLLALLLGGSPTTPGGETLDAAAGVVSSVASAAIGGVVQAVLPFRLDVLYYEPATATSGGAVVGGRWVTSKLLVLVRGRADPAADQNANEAELRYWLARRILLEAIGGDRGAFGLNLVWSRRW